jgi:O-antigen/teichoic acid export membrane protein
MLFKNTAAQSANLLTAYLFSLLLAPLMLSRLGLVNFGVWAVTGALATYMGLADFGITRSLARFVALYDVEGDRRAIAECIGLGLLAITGVTALAVLAALLTPPLFAGSLHAIGIGQLRLVLLCSVAIFSFTSYRRVLNAVEIGLRRMVPPNIANVFTNVVNFGFSIAALLVHPTLVAYGAANAASYLLGVGAAIASVRHVWGSVPVAWPSRTRAREIAGFGIKAQVLGLADIVNLQTDKLILAFAVGVRATAAYEIAARVVVAFRSIGILTISAMIPTFAAHIAQHGRQTLPRLYRRYTGMTVALAFPVSALACVTAPLLLKAWLGEVPERAAAVVVLLTLAYLSNLTCEVGMNIATGDGRPGLVASNSILAAGLNVVLTVALAPLLGFWGVLVGTAVALSLGSALFVLRFHRAYGLPLADYVRAVARPAMLSLGLGAVLALWRPIFGWQNLSRLDAGLAVLLIGAAYCAVYWPLASHLKMLPERLSLRLALLRRAAASSGTGS